MLESGQKHLRFSNQISKKKCHIVLLYCPRFWMILGRANKSTSNALELSTVV